MTKKEVNEELKFMRSLNTKLGSKVMNEIKKDVELFTSLYNMSVDKFVNILTSDDTKCIEVLPDDFDRNKESCITTYRVILSKLRKGEIYVHTERLDGSTRVITYYVYQD